MPVEQDFQESPRTYHAISRSLHWLMVFLILSLLGLGWGMGFIHGEIKPLAVTAHKSLGIILFFLFFVRLISRIGFPPPPLPDHMAKLMRLAAEATHIALYVLMLVLPLSGWMMASAMGRPPSLFGVIDIPALFEKNPALVPMLKDIHETGAAILAGFVILHAGASLFHHFVLKDGILARMLPKLGQ